MKLNPGNENVLEVLPHVATAAAAFGDPGGKYLDYIRSKKKNYAQQPFWLYDQTASLTMAPASARKSRREASDQVQPGISSDMIANPPTDEPLDAACPLVFDGKDEIELDPGIFTSCAVLRSFYPF